MIDKISIVESDSLDVFSNQGLELTLFDTVLDNEIILYLWSNENTVVIGANQDAYAEVKVGLLEQEGGKLARRLSGGGAVYHDKGNVNFTFIGKDDVFSLEDNRDVLFNGLKNIGLSPAFTGRNDIEIEGFKVSGNAYYNMRNRRYHHGTMLITLAPEKVSRYLTPAVAKFANKKVKSVESRVSYLKHFNEKIGKEDYIESIKKAFIEKYPNAEIVETKINEELLKKNTEFFADDKWRYNETDYTLRVPYVIDGDNVVLALKIKNFIIKKCDVFSDSMCYNKITMDKLVGTNLKESSGELIEIIREMYYEI